MPAILIIALATFAFTAAAEGYTAADLVFGVEIEFAPNQVSRIQDFYDEDLQKLARVDPKDHPTCPRFSLEAFHKTLPDLLETELHDGSLELNGISFKSWAALRWFVMAVKCYIGVGRIQVHVAYPATSGNWLADERVASYARYETLRALFRRLAAEYEKYTKDSTAIPATNLTSRYTGFPLPYELRKHREFLNYFAGKLGHHRSMAPAHRGYHHPRTGREMEGFEIRTEDTPPDAPPCEECLEESLAAACRLQQIITYTPPEQTVFQNIWRNWLGFRTDPLGFNRYTAVMTPLSMERFETITRLGPGVYTQDNGAFFGALVVAAPAADEHGDEVITLLASDSARVIEEYVESLPSALRREAASLFLQPLEKNNRLLWGAVLPLSDWRNHRFFSERLSQKRWQAVDEITREYFVKLMDFMKKYLMAVEKRAQLSVALDEKVDGLSPEEFAEDPQVVHNREDREKLLVAQRVALAEWGYQVDFYRLFVRYEKQLNWGYDTSTSPLVCR